MDVSKNRGTPKSSILIGFPLINHPFWGTTIFGNTHMAPINGGKYMGLYGFHWGEKTRNTSRGPLTRFFFTIGLYYIC